MKQNLTAAAISISVFFLSFSLASAGVILSQYKYAWSNYSGYINFEEVTVGNSSLGGHAWSENHGWIKFNPAQGGVTNDGTGNLSGYAWGEQLGWIDFDNVSINADGKFTGTASGDIIGTLTFNCGYCDVRTDWRRSNTSSSVTADGGGGILASQNILSPARQSSLSSAASSVSSQAASILTQTYPQSYEQDKESLSHSETPNRPPILSLASPSVAALPAEEKTARNFETPSASNHPSSIQNAEIESPVSFFNIINETKLIYQNLKKAYEKIPQKTAIVVGSTVVAPVTLGVQYLIVQGNFMPSVGGLSDLWLAFVSTLQGILSSVGIRKKKRYWGVVYDSKTKQPIDPALVELTDAATGKVIRQSITDISGRFGFLDSAGVYRLRAKKSNYVFPSALIAGPTDSIYENIYRGEPITVSEQNEPIAPNIPMDPVAFDWNQQAKQKIVKFHPKLEIAAHSGLLFVFLLGFVLVTANFIFEPGALSGAFMSFYILIEVARKSIPQAKLFGKVESAAVGVEGLVIEISPKNLPQIKFNRAFTTRGGKFFIMAPKGDYVLRVKRGDDSDAAILREENVSVGDDGVVNSVINV